MPGLNGTCQGRDGDIHFSPGTDVGALAVTGLAGLNALPELALPPD